MAKPSKRNPTFIWQPVLIVLPVIILAVFGFLFLRQDRALVRQEAAERAKVLADEMVANVWAQLQGTNEPGPNTPHAFQVDAFGELMFPPPAPTSPSPKPFDVVKLPAQQLRLWQNANRGAALGNRAEVTRAYQQFLDSKPPPEFAAAACYALGLLLVDQGECVDAAKAFDTLLDKYPNAYGESGISLAPLVQAKLIEIFMDPDRPDPFPAVHMYKFNPPFNRNGNRGFETNMRPAKHFVPVDVFCSNVVNNPTALTPYFLNRVWEPARLMQGSEIRQLVSSNQPVPRPLWGESEPVRQKWLAVWREHELLRKLHNAAIHAHDAELPKNDSSAAKNTLAALATRFFWFRMDAENWLCSRLNDNVTNTWFVCRNHREVCAALTAAAASTRNLPKYLGTYVEVGGAIMAQGNGTWWEAAHRTPGGSITYWSSILLPLATATHSQSGSEPLKVSVYLADSAELFRRQHVRSIWLGIVIAASAVGALIGLFSARRAFMQQQALAELKTNFVSSVSHEMRAPIASVRLMAESLERGKIHDSAKQSEYFRFIGQECRRLSGLIENVLDFSRIEQGRKQYQFEPTDLLALTRETVALMQTYAAEKRVKLNLVLPVEQGPSNDGTLNGDYQVSVDGRAIQQALVNLIDNALKHSHEGETVSVGLGNGQAGRGSPCVPPPRLGASNNASKKVLLWVEDRGPGIPATEHERIFERFYRLGSELRRETQGVGIGLSIVKHVVEAHNGTVKVESEPGKGSRFIIELPT